MRRVLGSLALLVLVYALVLASFHPWDLLGGALVGAALLAIFRRFFPAGNTGPSPSLPARLVASVPFALAILRETIAGTWSVALVSARLRRLPRSGIVAVPIGERSSAGVATTALATTLSPGSVLIDLDHERGLMLFHILDARDPDAFRREQAELYRRYQRKLIP